MSGIGHMMRDRMVPGHKAGGHGIRGVAGLVVAMSLVLLASCAQPPGPGERYRVPADFGEGLLSAVKDLTGPPPGANVPCRPTAEHPRPIILVHGFIANMGDSMNGLAPFFANQGFCVFALNYGGAPGSIFGGTGDIRRSSMDQFGPFVDDVLARTGAQQVDVIGHSEGSVMPRWWMRYGASTHTDGTPKVAHFVGVTPVTYGDDLGGYAKQFTKMWPFNEIIRTMKDNGCGACEQILAGSTFFEDLNTTDQRSGERFSGPVQPGTTYMMLATEWDNLVIPYELGFIDDPAVTNLTVQDVCAKDRADHLSVVFDPVAYDIINLFLDPAATQQRCVATKPVFAPVKQGHRH